MGGRWDATSAVNSIKSVAITGIGLDHMHILGDTLEAIAGEKAAIIKTGRTCVLGVGTATPASVEDVFLQQASAEGVQPCLLRPKFREQAQAEMHEDIMRAHPDLPASSYEIVHMPQALGDAVCARVTTPRSTYTDLLARKPSYQVANFSLAIVLCEQFWVARLTRNLCVMRLWHVLRQDALMWYVPRLWPSWMLVTIRSRCKRFGIADLIGAR